MSHNNFKVSDSQAGNAGADGGDAHLTNAQEEIRTSIGSQFVGTMRQDTSSGIIPSGNVEKSGSINFGPGDNQSPGDGHGHSSNTAATDALMNHTAGDGHAHNGATGDTQSSKHSPGDGDNHDGKATSEQAKNHAPGDGDNHDGKPLAGLQGSHSAGDGDNHDGRTLSGQAGNHAPGDGDNHDARVTNAQAGNHSVGDGHNHSNSSNAQANLVNGDISSLNEQSRMSQDAAKLGLGARDIALMQQMEGSVPHSSSRELAQRLKSARARGGILDLSKPADS